jgi:aminocarboxymuconate-semialdehyde decarboxylase
MGAGKLLVVMRLIDVHAHAFSAAYVDLLEQLGARDEVLAPARMVVAGAPELALRERLALMDESGVERQILSMSAATPYFDDAASAVRAARFLNDEHAATCRAHPARFAFFATLPLPHVDAALAELARACDELGAVGATFTTSILGRPLADPGFAPVLAELERRAAVVFLHPPGLACASELIRASGLAWSLGAPVEDALCALQLMQADVPGRYPRLKIILPHLGGFLPFLRYRLDRGAERRFPPDAPPSAQMRRFWYDTANGEPDALRHAALAYGVDRLVWGSDYPYWTGDSYRRAVEYVALAGFTDVELAGIRRENAGPLFAGCW